MIYANIIFITYYRLNMNHLKRINNAKKPKKSALGAGGPAFESQYPDKIENQALTIGFVGAFLMPLEQNFTYISFSFIEGG